MRVTAEEYGQLELRAHSLLADVPLHDVWAVDLPGGRPDLTLLELRDLLSAETVTKANPAVRFCFVSGHGAAVNGSRAWARIKGETEHDLEATFGSRLTVFRPAYIYPTAGRDTPYWGDTVMRPFMPLRHLMSRWITDCDEVACAVLHAATGGSVPSPASNRDIIAAAAAYASARKAISH